MGDTLNIKFYNPNPLLDEKIELIILHPKKDNFDLYFSNRNKVELDTVWSIYKYNSQQLKDSIYRRIAEMNYILNSSGKKNIRLMNPQIIN